MANTNFDAAVPMKQFRCPNRVRVWNAPQSGGETRFIFKEIFERRCYEQHGVAIADGDVILDIGANVELFALSVMERFRGVKMLCVEPVPNTRACLERNVTESPWRNHHEIAIVASAIGSTTSKTTITYFPRAPGNSTLHLSEKRQEWDCSRRDFALADLASEQAVCVGASAAVYLVYKAPVRPRGHIALRSVHVERPDPAAESGARRPAENRYRRRRDRSLARD